MRRRVFRGAVGALFVGALCDAAWWFLCRYDRQRRKDYHDFMLGKPL